MATPDPILHALVDLCKELGRLPVGTFPAEAFNAYHHAMNVIRDNVRDDIDGTSK